MPSAEMWFDPLCPFAWSASRWLLEAERVRDLSVRFRVMSLSVLNEALAAESESAAQRIRDGWGPVRVAMATELSVGAAGLRALYGSLGALIHTERAEINRDTYARALSRAGLPHALANAADVPWYDDEVRRSHQAAAGDERAGTPVVHVRLDSGARVGFFGPVLTGPPAGEAAGVLWDGLFAAARTDAFRELKRLGGRAA